jgi:hypothetical protein
VTLITRLGLNKLFLWSEAERFQTYAQAMAKLTPGRTYTRRQIGAEIFGLTYADSAKPRRESVLANVFGAIQSAPDKLLLRGINLFRRTTPNGSRLVSGIVKWELADDEWVPTEYALQLGDLYRKDSSGIQWQLVLAEQLARYESRTRVLLFLLSHGSALRFESSDYFSGNTLQAQLIGQDSCHLFADNGAAFNQLLFAQRDVAISHWWLEEIESAGFSLADSYRLEGATNRAPSTNYVNSALKTALFVFYRLGILIEQDGGWSVAPATFRRLLSAEIAHDLLGSDDTDPNFSNEWQRLSHVVKTLADEQGFIVVSEAADRWGELSDLPLGERLAVFDSLLRRGIFEGRIEVLDRHPGQPRMGRGLFDDDNMRMIKLRVLT